MRFKLTLLAVLFALAAASSQNAFATNATVGLCSGPGTHYTTIQAAVNAVAAGAAVSVCPGTYPEQVLIKKNLTLKGVASGAADAAIIAPPGGGLVVNATSTFDGSAIEAMLLVQNATVTLEYLTFDATGNGTVCGQDPVGIFYQNANGTVTRNNVLHVQVVGGFGCQGGLGIYVESGATTGQPNPSAAANSTVAISYNNVQDYDKNGITADGDGPDVKVTVTNNTVIGAGEVSDNAQNGIQLYGANNSTVSNNTLDGDWYTVGDYVATGILVISSSSPTISNNIISNTNVGIYLDSAVADDTDNATVSNNAITATHMFDGIVLCANLSTATGNKINVADESGINVAACGDAAPTNVVTPNTINGACAGILIDPPASATTTSNVFYNVINKVLTTGTDTCATPLVKKQGRARSHPAVSPARAPRR